MPGQRLRRIVLVAVIIVAGGAFLAAWNWWKTLPPAGVVKRLHVGNGPVSQVVFSPTGKLLAAGMASGDVTFFSRDAWNIVEKSAITTQPLTAMTATYDGHLIAATLGERLLLWDWSSLTSKVMPGVPDVPTAIAIHPTQADVLVGLRSGNLWRLNAISSESRVETLGHQAAVTSLVVGPRGEWLVSGSGDGELRITVPDDQMRDPLVRKEHTHPISGAVRSPSGRYIVTADWGGTAIVWTTADWTVKRRLEAGVAISRLAMTETAIYAGDWAGTVHIWNADTGEQRPAIECRYPIHGLAVDPKREWLVTASDQGTLDIRRLPEK